MKLSVTLIIALSITSSIPASGQQKQRLQKSWIKTAVYSLPGNEKLQDTLYTRYTFHKGDAYISFYPGWNGSPNTWSADGDQLTIGFTTWSIEALTDSTLTISQAGFRRMVFYAEDYLARDTAHLVRIGEFNNEPLYKANKYITPRYKKTEFRAFIEKDLEGYNIKKANYFAVSFIISKTGAVEDIRVIKGITEGFDASVIGQLKKTSGSWTPATFQGKPIQSQLIFDIKYLDSIVK